MFCMEALQREYLLCHYCNPNSKYNKRGNSLFVVVTVLLVLWSVGGHAEYFPRGEEDC